MEHYKKKTKKNAIITWIPLLTGLLLLAFIFLLQTELDEQKAQKVADQILDYASATCDRYDTYVRMEEAKDLMNLREKAEMISMYEKHGVAIYKDILDTYVEDENLTGVIVTDADRNIVLESGECEACDGSIFTEQLQEKEVTRILQFPLESYMERVMINGENYDYVVIAREKVKGLILCYHKVEWPSLGENEISIDSMMSGHLFKMDGMVVITDGKVMLNDNPLHVQGQSIEGCPIDVSNEAMWENGKLTRLDYKGKHWYGKRRQYNKYVIYVVYPSAQVFATRTTILAFGSAIYIFFLFILAFLRNHSAQTTMREMQKQLRIINAIGSTYKMNILIHLDTGEWEAIRMPGEIGAILQKEETAGDMLERYIQNFVAPAYQEGYRTFADLNNLEKRMRAKEYIPYTSEDDGGTWSYSILAPQQWDEHGVVKAVVWAIRDVTADRQKELSYQKKLEQAAHNS